jgi:peptidoglycan/LPS O-acetylase OafA/YrhL
VDRIPDQWLGFVADLFLVISGFVIGKTAMEAFERDPNWWCACLERRLRRFVSAIVFCDSFQ